MEVKFTQFKHILNLCIYTPCVPSPRVNHSPLYGKVPMEGLKLQDNLPVDTGNPPVFIQGQE